MVLQQLGNDRLARSLPQLIETVAQLEVQEIGFRSLIEAIDTATAGGKLIFHIFGALAEFERAVSAFLLGLGPHTSADVRVDLGPLRRRPGGSASHAP